MRRALTIVIAYLAASVCGAVIFTLCAAISEGDVSNLFPAAILFLTIGSVVAFPFALPVIIWSEISRKIQKRSFALAGAIIGTVILVLYFVPTHATGEDAIRILTVAAMLLLATTSAALVYWLVAWRIDPPIETK